MFPRKWLSIFTLLSALWVSSIGCQREIARPSVLAAPLSSAKAPINITIAAVGDIMLGSTHPPGRGLPPEDGATMLKEVTPLLTSADVTFGNLEGPMLEGGTTSKCRPTSKSCFAYRVPTRYGKYLKDAGFDVMSVANNHASDFGAEGRESTKRVLDSLGIAHAGSNYDDIAYLNVKGKRIGVIAFATNNVSYNVNDIETARRVVARVKAKCDLLIISFHAGAEGAAAQHVPKGPETYLREARGDLRLFTHAVVDSGADLLLGHGPHVVRGMEVYRNRLIVYSLGNFAFHGFRFAGPTGLSLVLEVTLGSDGTFVSGLIHPLIETPEGPRPDKDQTIIPIVRALSTEDFGLGSVKVNDDGIITPP